jgi:hypothetical protein
MKKISVAYDETEWLYAPDVVYSEIDGLQRRLQLFLPYRREWKGDVRFRWFFMFPVLHGTGRRCITIPKVSKLAECGMVVAMVSIGSVISQYFRHPLGFAPCCKLFNKQCSAISY